VTEENKTMPRFFRSSFSYLFGNILSKIAVFFMLPLYTARIPSADMGYYDTATAVVILVASVLFLDVGIGLMRFMLGAKDERAREEILSSGLVIVLLSSLLYVAVALAVALLFEIPYYPLIVLYGLLNAVMTAFGYVARARGFVMFYALSGAVSTLLQVILNLVLILVFDWGYASLYVAFCCGALVSIVMLTVRCGVRSFFSLGSARRETVARLIRFSLPLGINSAAFWLLNSLNRVLVTVCLGAEQNGYYAIAMKFTQILIFFSTCFQFAWQEVSFAKGFEKKEEDRCYYAEKTDLFLRIFMAALLLLIPGARVGLWLFPGFIHESYSAAIDLLPVALLGAFMSVLASFLDPIFSAARKNGMILLSTALGAAVNVSLVLLLFRLGTGVIAANIAFLAGYTVTVAVRIIGLRRTSGLTLPLCRYLWFLPAVAGVTAAFYLLKPALNIALIPVAALIAFLLLREELGVIFRRSIGSKDNS